MPGERMGDKTIVVSNKYMMNYGLNSRQYVERIRVLKRHLKKACGITLRRSRGKRHGLMDIPILEGRISDEALGAAIRAFHEFLLSFQDKRMDEAFGWTMVLTGRNFELRDGPVEELRDHQQPINERRIAKKTRTKKGRTTERLPDWLLVEFPNCVIVDQALDERLRTDAATFEGWEGRIYHDLSCNLDIMIYYLKQIGEMPLAPEGSIPEGPVPFPAHGPREACKARNDAWVRTIDPSYDPSRRDRTGPGALGGSLFCANMALHRKGFRKDEDPSRYDVVLPSPEELGLVRCTDRCDLPMALIRSEVSVDNVRSRGNGMTVDVTVTNPGNQPMTVRIPQGMAFEVDSPELGVQSLVASKTIEIPLKPGETRTVPVDCFCANSRFQSPIGSLMKITPYKTAVALGTQDAVWNYFGRGDSYGGCREGIYRYR